MKKAASYPSTNARIVAARIDPVICLSLFEIHVDGTEFKNLPHINVMYPPWLLPSLVNY